MTNDDWDSVSNDTLPDSETDDWDAVSTPQPQRQRRVAPDNVMSDNLMTSRQDAPVTPTGSPHQDTSKTSPTRQTFMPVPVPRKAAIFGAVVLLLLGSSFGVFRAVSIHSANVSATVTAQAKATTIAKAATTARVEAVTTATAQTAATATVQTDATPTAQQIYTQATSGTPSVNDPLTDDTNNWGLFTTNWGGQCAFTGGAYHLSLSKVGYWLVCTGGSMGVLKSSVNFALQVQISIVQGNYGGIIFGADTTPGGASNAYRIDISPVGAYLLYQIQNKQSLVLQQGLDPAIKTGLNQPNVITIIVKNSNFYLYANSQFVISQKLTAYTPGEGDFEALSPDQPTDVAYSNLKLWTL